MGSPREAPIRMDDVTDVSDRQSIAESNISESLRRQIVSFTTLARTLLEIIDVFKEGKMYFVEKRYELLRHQKDEIENESISLTEYIVKVAPGLLNKELYVFVLNDLVRASEHIEAAAFRVLLLSNGKGSELMEKFYDKVTSMISDLISMASTVESMVMKINNTKAVSQLYRDIVKLEVSIDETYRELGLETLKYLEDGISRFILIREMIDKIESAADLLKRMGAYIRVISLQL